MYDTVGSDWQALGGVQYRRLEIYPLLDWGGSSEDCRLDQHVVAAAPCGGPVAMVRDDAALVKLVGAAHAPPLRIFTSSGKLLAEVPWEGPSAGGRLIAMGWTSGELLVTVRDQGLLQLRDLRGTLLHSLMLLDSPPSVTSDGTLVLITHAVVSGDSVAAATSDLQLLAVEHLHQHAPRAPLSAPRCRAFTLGRGALQRLRPRPNITAVAVSNRCTDSSNNSSNGSTNSAALELTVATAGGDTWLVSEEAAVRAVLPEELQISGGSSIVQMAVSPGGVFVACFTAAGLLLVLKDSLSLQVRSGRLLQCSCVIFCSVIKSSLCTVTCRLQRSINL
jgi:Vps16, N-terminal region